MFKFRIEAKHIEIVPQDGTVTIYFDPDSNEQLMLDIQDIMDALHTAEGK